MRGVLSPLSRPVLWQPNAAAVLQSNPRYSLVVAASAYGDVYRNGKLYWEMTVNSISVSPGDLSYLGAARAGSETGLTYYVESGEAANFNTGSTVAFIVDTVARICKYSVGGFLPLTLGITATDNGGGGPVTLAMETNTAGFDVTLRTLRQDFLYAVPPGFTPFGEM